MNKFSNFSLFLEHLKGNLVNVHLTATAQPNALYSNKYALATSVKPSLSSFLSAFYGQAFHTGFLLYKAFPSLDLDRKRSFNYFDEFFTPPVISLTCIQPMMLHMLGLSTMSRTGAGEPNIKTANSLVLSSHFAFSSSFGFCKLYFTFPRLYYMKSKTIKSRFYLNVPCPIIEFW